jgi:hypothetical protein
MRNKTLRYIFFTGIIFIGLMSVHTCSLPVMRNKTLYQSDVIVVHYDRSVDTLKDIVFFDYLRIDQMDNLIKKDGFVVSTKVKKFKYLKSIEKKL